MAIPTPVVNAPNLYINGLGLTYLTATTFSVAAGRARNSTDVNDIISTTALTLNTAERGANGLDQGSMANNTFYAVFIVADSYLNNSPCVLISTSATAPLLPYGYDMFRRIGYVLTNGSAQILDFTQRGSDSDRNMWYADAIATNITAGAATSFATVTASAGAPPLAKQLFVKAVLTADAGATRTAALRETSSGSTAGQVFMSSPASTVTTASLVCPCGTSGEIDYLVSNASAALALSVSGYLDSL